MAPLICSYVVVWLSMHTLGVNDESPY